MNNLTTVSTDLLISELTRWANNSRGNTTVEQIVLEHGAPFTGVDRPRGMRLGPIKNCYRNSYKGATSNDMLYVEGFAMVDDRPPFHHAWISPDGITAIDLTLRRPPSRVRFFGIPFSIGLATRELVETGRTLPLIGTWKPRTQLYLLAEKARYSAVMNGPAHRM
jgi:hypothetical protein